MKPARDLLAPLLLVLALITAFALTPSVVKSRTVTTGRALTAAAVGSGK